MTKVELISMYKDCLLPRLIEERMLLLLRQGKVSKWFSGIGQEAIAVGCTLAMHDDEYILPLHRNLGVFTCRKVPLGKLFCQLQGKAGGFSGGRERSFHFGIKEQKIVGMISHLGPQLSIADGIALAHTLKSERKAALVFTGEGGTSQGEFHEALNIAAVWNLPVIFVIENNGYGLSTPVEEQFRCKYLSEKAPGYGMEGVSIDGNDIEKVFQTVSGYAESIRKKPRPILIECMTFRMRGHEEASGVKYVPKKLFEEWAKKDPVINFEQKLLKDKVLTATVIDQIRNEHLSAIEVGLEEAFADTDPVADAKKELEDLFYPNDPLILNSVSPNSKKRFVDAVSDSLRLAMRRYPNLVLMGQDIAGYGGVFKVTEGFVEEFGSSRVRNTPLCESGIIGTALGLSIGGFKSVVEMQFADFVSCGFNQIVNNLAKIYWRWGQNADVVIRMPTGAGTGAGPFHSQSNEAWFFHVPGLKIVYPSTPYDAKGLLLSCISDPNPVLYFEHKVLYRSIQEEIPDGEYTVPIGKAKIIQDGDAITIITYGMGVHWAKGLAAENPDVSVGILDLRSLQPLDYEAIDQAVKKTGRVLILHEDTLTGGIGGEISAYISQNLFEHLDAPVMRCASLDTPVPFASVLEKNFLAQSRLSRCFEELMRY